MVDFEGLMKREPASRRSGGQATEFFQCVVFYGSPMLEEIQELPKVLKKRGRRSKELSSKLEKTRITFPLYSKEIFMTQEDATKFFPIFIKKLIGDNMIPADIILPDRSVDETRVKFGVVPLEVTTLQEEKSEFKNF